MKLDPLHECLFIVRDEFGRQVADYCGIPARNRMSVKTTIFAAMIPYAPLLVAVHAGRDISFRDRIDSVASVRSIPSIGLELLPTRIICGPAVVPGRSACYGCYVRRTDQHSGSGGLETSTTGLAEGFGPEHVAVGVGMLRSALGELKGDIDGLGGTVKTMDLVTGFLGTAQTVAVNRCERCGHRFRRKGVSADAVSGLG